MASMTQEQIDKRIAELGGSSLTHSNVASKKRIPNPNYNATQVAAGRSNEPEYIEVEVQQWVAPNGHVLQAYQKSDGTWEVERDEPKAPSTTTTAPASAGSGATVQIEGTPDPSKPGGYDNERPVKVTRDAKGNQVGLAVPLTGKDLEDWRTDREKSRNPGNKSDAEIKADKEKADAEAARNRPKETREPVQGKPGYTKVTKADPATGKTETYYEDANGVRTQLPGDQKDERVAIRGKDGKAYTKVTKVDPATGKSEVYYENEAGQKVPPPEDQKPPIKLPADAPQLDNSTPEAAYQSYMKLYQYLNQKVLAGGITPEDAKALLAGPHQAVSTQLERQREERQAEEARRRDQLTERGQDMTQSGNRASWSNQSFSNAAAADKANQAGAKNGSSSLVPLMVLQAGMAQAAGGFQQSPNITMGSGLMPAVATKAGEGFTAPPAPSTVAAAPGGAPAPLLPPRPPVPAQAPAGPASAEAARQAQSASGGAATATPALAPPPQAASVPPALPRDAQGNAPANAPLNIRHKQTGMVKTVSLQELNAMPDRDQYDVLDPDTNQPINQGVAAPPTAVAPPVDVPSTGAPYAPQMGSVPAGTSGDALQTAPPAETWQPPARANPVAPWQPGGWSEPQPPGPVGAGTEAGGNVQMAPPSPWGPLGGPTAAYQAGTQYGQPATAEDLEMKLIQQGYSPQEVRAARERAAQRAGVMVA